MPPAAELLSPKSIVLATAAALTVLACATVWALLAARWSRRQPVLPHQPRRPVPWVGLDLLLVVLFYLTAQSGVAGLARVALDPGDLQTPPAGAPEESTAEHLVARLCTEGNGWVLLLCFVAAVVVAPLVEELFFRVLLQGCLEAAARRWRRRAPALRRLIPRAAGPIVLTSLLFAAMHFRTAGPAVNPRLAVFLLAGDVAAKLLMAVFAVCLVRWRAGATAADLGWVPQKLLGDVRLGLIAFAAIAAPLYLGQAALVCLLPKSLAPDPLPLFFLALVLGALYYRTHRIVPSIVVHAALNATSLALEWWAM